MSSLSKNHFNTVSLDSGDRVYTVNGVKYTVSSYFIQDDPQNDTSLRDRIKKYIGSAFADLPFDNNPIKMESDYVCLTAGKEDQCSQTK